MLTVDDTEKNRWTTSRDTISSGRAQRAARSSTPPRDSRELVSVPEERDASPGLVGDGEKGAGGVLVEHPRFVHQQEVARFQHGRQGRARGLARPAAVVVPSPSVLVGEPCCGVRACPGVTAGDRGRLQGRRHDDHPMRTLGEQRTGCREGGGLAGSRCVFDDQKLGVASERCDSRSLRDVKGACLDMIDVGEAGKVGGLLCAVDEPGDDVGLDGQHLGRGQCSECARARRRVVEAGHSRPALWP
jgi:hypothetical protein